MPFNEADKTMFIHIPKTGGTTLERIFGMEGNECFLFERWDRDMDSFLIKHRHALEGQAKKTYEPQHYPPGLLRLLVPDYDEYFKFTFVRHPYTRMLSEYYWSRGAKITSRQDFDPVAFDAWCRNFLATIDQSHKEPQTFYIDDSVRFTGRFERMEEDLSALWTELARTRPVFRNRKVRELPRLLGTGISKEWLVESLLPSTRMFLHEVYAEDFKALGYDPYL